MSRSTIIVLLLAAICLAAAKKGGKLDLSQVVNPDPDYGKSKSKSPEFNPELLEGDIATKDGATNSEDRNGVKDVNKLWPQGTVPYVLDSSLTSNMRDKIKQSIRDYETYTCIKWVPRKGETDYVFINSQNEGCYAFLGRSGGQQPLNLEDGNPGCGEKGTVIHEMLHTIGFAHEQSRNDRDRYITVNWQNMRQSVHSQFKKMEQGKENSQGLGYDYYSVMHYPDWGFSMNGKPTIVTKDPKMQKVIGQRAGFSKQDIKEVNGLYKCNGKTSGIGGKNGCLDTSTNCKEMLSKYTTACNSASFSGSCKQSCNRC